MFRPELLSFLALLQRSKDEGDGWRVYSRATRALVKSNNEKFPGLFEVDADNFRVRTTEEGNILVKWMNYGKD
jgi:hypothetical protein